MSSVPSYVLVLTGLALVINFSQVSAFKLTKEKGVDQIRNSIHSRCIQPGTLHITFDDGPATLTESVLDVLRDNDVPATFFVNGINSMNLNTSTPAQGILRRAQAEGHLIASHDWTHDRLTNMTMDQMIFQLVQLEETLNGIVGKRGRNMRPPYGSRNATVDTIVIGLLGYEVILWSIDTMDWSHPGDTAAGLKEYVDILNGTDPKTTMGFIALHHDPQRGGAELAQAVIDYVRSVGYRFVTLEECLGF